MGSFMDEVNGRAADRQQNLLIHVRHP